MTVLLSIKPEFADKIFSGEKKYEYRKYIQYDILTTTKNSDKMSVRSS